MSLQSVLSPVAEPYDPVRAPPQPLSWSLPPRTEPRLVLPDRYTDLSTIDSGLIGKQVDPGRMGIYICMLE
ncbi:MAG: hypothetical protein TREMPRED_005390, partial [Tremellales sp. Tagirdzhanova-0007]